MKRIFLAAIVVVAAALPCQAQGEKPKANTLTPKEIADGWILLFDGETTFGWTAANGEIKVENGVLNLGGVGAGEIFTSVNFESFELSFDYLCNTKQTLFGVFGVQPGVESHHGQFVPKAKTWSTVRFLVQNGKIKIKVPGVDNEVANFAHDWTKPCVFRVNQGENTVTKLRNFKLKPLAMQPIFNGNDLTGWKAFPGEKYKSKFTVGDGAIHVKNGPGDLQTTGRYKDFVLQLECKSNGPHLNSGIFFRCRDGEYQNGYECQIRNQFHEKPDQKYSIEEYDPKTNKLLGKKDVMFTAVDYGTGAIYRRQPARKEMSKDGEWFTMTIVAHGNHLATWVNGVQVTDWTDNRPKSDNARTGCKLDAGHISIQGHDPTTDLSFRNIRIAEFK